MATTIHVETETKQLLASLKREEKARSINEVILWLLKESKKGLPKSFFGVDKGKKIKVVKMETHEI